MSGGPFASLNLGRKTADDGANVDANRDRLAAAVGLPRDRFLYGIQVHGTSVRRATEPPGAARPAVEEDGQATALPDAAALVFVADCLPVLLAASGAVAALHCGWRGLAGGIVGEGVAALREVGGSGPITAAVGPERAAAAMSPATRSTRTSPPCPAPAPAGATWTSRRSRATSSSAAGVDAVHDSGLCTMCSGEELFFSHRRDGGVTGRQAGVVWRVVRSARVRENAERVRGEIDAAARRAGRAAGDVELLAAVKYVGVEDVGALLEAGVTLLGENRAQELEAKSAAWPDARAGTSSASSRAARSSRSCRWSS